MRYSLLISPLLSGLLTFWMSQLALCAYDPQLNEVFPRGGMRGETVQVSFRGNRLDEAKSVVFYREGVKLGKIEKTKNNKLEGEFIISPKAGLGEYPFRLVCEDGVTYQRSFWVVSLE